MITTSHEVCVSNVIREGDSAEIMKALQSDEVSLAPNGSLIEDVKVNYSIGCSLIEDVKVNYSIGCFFNYVTLVLGDNIIKLLIVLLECNKVAHSLTRYTIHILDFAVCIEDVLLQFISVLQADLANIS